MDKKQAYEKLRDASKAFRDKEGRLREEVIDLPDREGKLWDKYKAELDELGKAVGKAFYEYSVANDIPNNEATCVKCVRPGTWIDRILAEEREKYEEN